MDFGFWASGLCRGLCNGAWGLRLGVWGSLGLIYRV